MEPIISIKSLKEKRELIDLLDQSIALGVQLNQQLSSMGNLLETAHFGEKLAA